MTCINHKNLIERLRKRSLLRIWRLVDRNARNLTDSTRRRQRTLKAISQTRSS